ncbi:MAG: helix-turn-helix domain-containing protein [Bdellovibrionales bacterium]
MAERSGNQTYYELLEIPQSAGPMDIYNAYQRARKTYSPSSPALYSMFSPEEASQLMSLIEEAYQTLSHQGRRKEYDQKIGLGATPTPPKPAKSNESPGKNKADDAWVGQVRTVPKRDELPKGFARTRYSVYEVKPDLESEIQEAQEMDGPFLQKIRLYKGVKIEQICDELRMTKTSLVALESNDLDALPVPVFTRGFIVGIARVLGLDGKKTADAYMKFFKANKK